MSNFIFVSVKNNSGQVSKINRLSALHFIIRFIAGLKLQRKLILLFKKAGGFFFILLFLLQDVEMSKGQNPSDSLQTTMISRLWRIREHFIYSVKYGPFTLGSVTLDIMPDSLYEGKKCRYVRAIIKSNPSLPFVGNREDAFSSLMMKNDTIPYDVLYWEDDIDRHQMKTEIYKLDYDKGKVYTYIKSVPGDTLSIDEPSICGPAFFFYTRVFAGTNKHLKIPLYIDEKKNFITLNSTTNIEDIGCKAYPDGHILTYVSFGDANFDGPFGFRGQYKAWYTTGALRIPIQAYLKVWLGHVKIRLVKYSKKEISPDSGVQKELSN